MTPGASRGDLAAQTCVYFDLQAEKSFPLLRRNIAHIQRCRRVYSRSERVANPPVAEAGPNYIYIEMLPAKPEDETPWHTGVGNDTALTQKLELPTHAGQKPQTIMIKSIPGYRARLVPLPALNATMDAFNSQTELAQHKFPGIDYVFHLGDSTRTIFAPRYVCFLCPAGDFNSYTSLFLHLTTRHCNFDFEERPSGSDASHMKAGVIVKALPPLRCSGFTKFAKQEGNFQLDCADTRTVPVLKLRMASRARRIMSRFERVSESEQLGFPCTSLRYPPTREQNSRTTSSKDPSASLGTPKTIADKATTGSHLQPKLRELLEPAAQIQGDTVPAVIPPGRGQLDRAVPLSPQISAPITSSKMSSQNRSIRSIPTFTLLRAKQVASTGKARSSSTSSNAQTRHLSNAVNRTVVSPEVVQGRIKFRVPAAPGDGRYYFRNVSKRLLEEGELLSESDDDVDQEWVFQKHRDRIRSSPQLSAEQKDFLCRYDVHMLRADLQGMRYVPAEIQRFIKANHQWLESPAMRAEMTDKIHWLQQEGTISACSMVECLKALQTKMPIKGSQNPQGLMTAVK